MYNRGRTNDDGKCRFHPSIQLHLLTKKGKWLQIMKECPLCLAYEKIPSKSNPLLTSPQMSSTFNEQIDGDELPSSASSTKDTKSSSPTSVVIPMTGDRLELAIQMIPSVPFSTTALTKSSLIQTSSSSQGFLPSKTMVNRHDKDYVESKLVVCRMNDEVCYVNRQTECLRTEHINDLIQEIKSIQLMTRHTISQSTASTSSFSRSDDDNNYTRSNSAPVSSIRRLHSNGSDTDSSSAPSLSSCSYSTFGSCDTLGQCIYHPNIQLKTQSTCEGLKTGKWKTVAASCSECDRELGQRNILNSLTSSEKDLMKKLLSSCEIDRSDRTDSNQNRRVSFAELDDIITFWS